VAASGRVGGAGADCYLNDTFSGQANTRFSYGDRSDQAYVGDWDGNGTDTVLVRRGNTFYARNSNAGGPADTVFTYGDPGARQPRRQQELSGLPDSCLRVALGRVSYRRGR
jgi:hypothetical protein